MLHRAPTQPVDIKLSASRRSECTLPQQAREMLLGVETLPHGSYQLTAVVRGTEMDLCLYSSRTRQTLALQKVLHCTLVMPLMKSLTSLFVCQSSRLLLSCIVWQQIPVVALQLVLMRNPHQ